MYQTEHQLSSLNEKIVLDLLKVYPSNYFFETGTNTGKGIEVALSCCFNNIISLDVEEKFVTSCREKFFDKNVKIHLADSSKEIETLIKNINERIYFWLDGHAFYSVPLLQEIEQISKHHIKNHVIMVDDVRMFGNPLWNNLQQEDVKKAIVRINNKYKFSYRDSPNGQNDILIAYVE